MPKRNKPISLRNELMGACVDLLRQEGMSCVQTQDGLVELINQLVNYKEEGRALYPEIYIFDNLEMIKKVVPGEFHEIGEGAKNHETMLKALKKCAPLAIGNWAIYILRNEETFNYGLFRSGTSLLSVSISETLINNGSEELKVILVHPVADRLIEVKGVKSDTLIINFGSKTDSQESPIEEQNKFIEVLVSNVEEKFKDQIINLYKKVFLEILQKGHGTLACIINDKGPIPKKMSDGIILKKKINVLKSISELMNQENLINNSILDGQFDLILGMMQSDGITVFTTKGEIAAYNIFIKHSSKILADKSIKGGARTRTFLTMCEMIGNGLKSAYIQSQDGKVEYK